MPELPEVEGVVRKLRPRLAGKTIRDVSVRRLRVIAPTSERELVRALKGARFLSLRRRGKYLIFKLRRGKASFTLLGHLGMSGDMYVLARKEKEPKHAAVVLALGTEKFVYEDTRYFGRFTLDTRALDYLGPEPLGKRFALEAFAQALRRSSQRIKVKLLDQCLVAGLGNIYASEALFRAGISPRTPARRLSDKQIARLWKAIPKVLEHAIRFGTTRGDNYIGGLAVYDRKDKLCRVCKTPIRRIVQGGRSTYFCPKCQAE
ncbi:MAG TPA: bifunctional DNA-formamidopyrimidine glycosylase/DNA-(apurinic or apyrimidinic site) lyase [Candidatus Binatia bacterium]|nr:bifunctional DNA-formamidopyrimidine glycosylase/DNA-(apurinic or apyrimidinic site) lyase [Candidatus Binatia bacterium]